MPENLLQKLEEKMMMVISEVEELRKETHRLNQENSSLKTDKENHAKKLQDLISLLDTLSFTDNVLASSPANLSAVKPLMVQGEVFG